MQPRALERVGNSIKCDSVKLKSKGVYRVCGGVIYYLLTLVYDLVTLYLTCVCKRSMVNL